MSSGPGVRFYADGLRICGGVINGSFKCASPSTKMVEMRL